MTFGAPEFVEYLMREQLLMVASNIHRSATLKNAVIRWRWLRKSDLRIGLDTYNIAVHTSSPSHSVSCIAFLMREDVQPPSSTRCSVQLNIMLIGAQIFSKGRICSLVS
jgi:hypothetical protein